MKKNSYLIMGMLKMESKSMIGVLVTKMVG